jgi:hypothetical protein
MMRIRVTYKDREAFLYQQTEHFSLISYTNDDTLKFSVPNYDVKLIKEKKNGSKKI